ncbi:PepSY domain-containing protein [Jeotgalibacillus sp. ET6]|uniref:PepSY domain-containing protein n=1 Tax=Jeotgalibacillus sp. ET6 TaxID=3037260 RepID=UPI0024185688|nr:PepSY domain-containing protein [Jeotgalibacillus sp. ET6]MDG5471229.1 PepSY domain-containing protein [Jeotgalibacillus sp. ET6]
MKNKLLIGGIAGAVILGGGAFGMNAFADSSNNWSESDADLTQEEAETIATEEVEGLTITTVERDDDDGRYVYEIDGTTEDGREADVEVDANSGEILKVGRDLADSQDDQVNENVEITKEEAEEIAKTEGKGDIVKSELDDGHYEIEMRDGDVEYEIDINGQTGEVMEFEMERDDN